MVGVLIGLAAIIAFAPVALCPSPAAHAVELARLTREYWVVADHAARLRADPAIRVTPPYERAFSEQLAIRKQVHLLGAHIDDDHDSCEWSGFLGSWRILLARFAT